MLEKGIIEESESPWASAYVLARKKNGEYRLCVDFRKLNAKTKKLAYPLPIVDDCLETLAGKRFFTQLDFASGFWQLPLAKESRELTAFRTEDGLFQYRRMPFGLLNAPASFQRLINALLAGLKGLSLQCFIDDICVATSTWSEHISLLEKVFKLIIDANLKLKSTKCVFGAHKIVFLGHEISEAGIRQDPSKLRALLAMPPPIDAGGVKRVLGMLAYYRRFVPQFATVAEPLTRLTRKKAKFVWQREQKVAFESLLGALEKNATLAHFNNKDPVMLKTDASRVGIAAMLFQQQKGEWKLVTCTSRRLSVSE